MAEGAYIGLRVAVFGFSLLQFHVKQAPMVCLGPGAMKRAIVVLLYSGLSLQFQLVPQST